MLVTKYYRTRADGVVLNRTYSDAGLYIRKVGTDEVYSDAVDIEGVPYTYEETEEPIEDDP